MPSMVGSPPGIWMVIHGLVVPHSASGSRSQGTSSEWHMDVSLRLSSMQFSAFQGGCTELMLTLIRGRRVAKGKGALKDST